MRYFTPAISSSVIGPGSAGSGVTFASRGGVARFVNSSTVTSASMYCVSPSGGCVAKMNVSDHSGSG